MERDHTGFPIYDTMLTIHFTRFMSSHRIIITSDEARLPSQPNLYYFLNAYFSKTHATYFQSYDAKWDTLKLFWRTDFFSSFQFCFHKSHLQFETFLKLPYKNFLSTFLFRVVPYGYWNYAEKYKSLVTKFFIRETQKTT